jgi:sugar phosphate isomerase/epimerase
MTQSAFGVHPHAGISAWSFHKRWRAKTMTFPRFFAAVRGLGVNKVEINSPHFFDGTGEDILKGIKQAADVVGVAIVNIAVDDKGFDLSSTDEANRAEAVARTIKWLDAAVILGCPNVRNNTGGANAEACGRSFRELAVAAGERGRRILIEAHGGFSSDAGRLLPIVLPILADHPTRIGLIPDFGNVNITPERDRYQQIADLAPHAVLVHPKMHDFDEHGQQPEWDTQRLVNIVRKTGFRGTWMIEYEGVEDPYSGVRRSLALLSSCLRA